MKNEMIRLKLSPTHNQEYGTQMSINEVHAKEVYEQLKEVFKDKEDE